MRFRSSTLYVMLAPSHTPYQTPKCPAQYQNSNWSWMVPVPRWLDMLNSSPADETATVRWVASSRLSGTPSWSESTPSATAKVEARTRANAAEEASAIARKRTRAKRTSPVFIGAATYKEVIRRSSKPPGPGRRWEGGRWSDGRPPDLLARAEVTEPAAPDQQAGKGGCKRKDDSHAVRHERRRESPLAEDPDQFVPDLEHPHVRPVEANDPTRRTDFRTLGRRVGDPPIDLPIRDDRIRQVAPEGLGPPA